MPKVIVCAGMPRSGSTLQYGVVKELILANKDINLVDLGWVGNCDIHKKVQENPHGYILFKTHNYIEDINNIISEEDLFVFSTYRDMRDIIVSLMAFKKTSFEHVFSKDSYLKIINDFERWSQHSNFIATKYEEFYEDVLEAVKNYYQFLNFKFDESLLSDIVDKVNLQNGVDKNFKSTNEQYDRETLLHKNHINNKKWGQWKDKLTKSQIGVVQYYSKDWLKRFGYKIQPTFYNYKPVLMSKKATAFLKRFVFAKVSDSKTILSQYKYRGNIKRSFSQNGEDILIKTLFDIRKVRQITYLDIGSNDPIKLNNTFLLYLNNHTGVNVDANPTLVNRMNQIRPKDENLNVGIASKEGYLDFYIMENDKISTFSNEEFQNNLKLGLQLKKKAKIKVTTVNNIIFKYFDGKFPDLLNIDVEGLEWDILKSINLKSDNTPKVICLETAEHSLKGNGSKRHDIIQYVINQNYHHYADTHFNSILVRKDFWYF